MLRSRIDVFGVLNAVMAIMQDRPKVTSEIMTCQGLVKINDTAA